MHIFPLSLKRRRAARSEAFISLADGAVDVSLAANPRGSFRPMKRGRKKEGKEGEGQ